LPRTLLYIACFSLCLTLLACVVGQGDHARAEQSPSNTDLGTTQRLFGTVEFRGNLDILENWQKIVTVAPQQLQQFSSTTDQHPLQSAQAWQELIQQLTHSTPRQQAVAVNQFFNQWPYRQDNDIWQRNDYWETPLEFLRQSGDCEDYAICKYFALRYLGFTSEQLRIVILRDTIRSITHAVLAVYLNNDILILDNLSSPVFSHQRYQHYVPQYSVNEFHRWMHIKPRTKRQPPLKRSTGD